MSRVLVAYGTSHGSTHEVAKAIGGRLRNRGVDVDVEPAAAVESLDAYAGVVLGGAIYMGRWHADARDFLKRHGAKLAAMPVAVFGMGPQTTSSNDFESSRRQVQRALSKAPDLEPRTTAIFGGVVDPEKLRFPFNRMAATDARDWAAIEAWADELPAALGLGAPAPA
jgi:menaquinone-dependent protoporphyrinogen oxidase